jgi:serine/threonine protein kinase
MMNRHLITASHDWMKKDCIHNVKGNYLGRIVKERYRIIRDLFSGDDGNCFFCEDVLTGKFVDMRIIPYDYKDAEAFRDAELQFKNELDVLCRLEHPGMPQIIEGFTEKLEMFIITEHAEGETLEAKLKKKKQLPLEEVLALSNEILRILDYLHSRYPPVIFRDMRPCNILIKGNGRVQLANFGLARTYKPFKDRDTIVRCSKGYASPEQYGGKGQTDARADIYSFGITLHQMLTGNDPAHTVFKLPPLEAFRSDLGHAWQEIVSKATSLRQETRFQTAKELMNALKDAGTEKPHEAKVEKSGDEAPKMGETAMEAGDGEEPEAGVIAPIPDHKAGREKGQKVAAFVVVIGMLLLIGAIFLSLKLLKGFVMILAVLFASFLFLGIAGYFLFLRT